MYSYCSRIFGIAPLLELADRERQRLVEHGVDHVDEGHAQHRGRRAVRPQVEHRADQEAARAAALDHEPVGRGVAVLHQVIGRRDEVGERVALGHHPALVVPALAQLAAAADVGDGHAHPAVEQAQPVGREAGRVRDSRRRRSPRAASGPSRRAAASARQTSEIGTRVPSPRDRVDALGAVAGRGRSRRAPRLCFSSRSALPRHVVVEHRGGGDQRLVAEPIGVGLELRVGVRVDGRRSARGTARGGARRVRGVGDAQADQAVLALVDHVVVGEHLHVLQHHVVAVGHELLPAAPGPGRRPAR